MAGGTKQRARTERRDLKESRPCICRPSLVVLLFSFSTDKSRKRNCYRVSAGIEKVIPLPERRRSFSVFSSLCRLPSSSSFTCWTAPAGLKEQVLNWPALADRLLAKQGYTAGNISNEIASIPLAIVWCRPPAEEAAANRSKHRIRLAVYGGSRSTRTSVLTAESQSICQGWRAQCCRRSILLHLKRFLSSLSCCPQDPTAVL